MEYENGNWIMRGVSENDPGRIKTSDELIDYINRVGFLPLFSNEIPGFSVEEHVSPNSWWTDDPRRDPWMWRMILAGSGKVAYGKFFDKKAGFISLEWFPDFVNWRRDGYDFDARWDDNLATVRSRKIMELFGEGEELFSFEVRKSAGFGAGGEKNFEGTITQLQMQTYLVVRDFRRRINKSGEPYGWSIIVYSTPESIWGREAVTSRYDEEPTYSRCRIFEHLQKLYPDVPEQVIRKVLK